MPLLNGHQIEIATTFKDFWSDLDDAVEIDIEEIKTSAPSVGFYRPWISLKKR